MIKLKRLITEIGMDVQPPAIIKTASTNQFSSNFLNYIKTCENSIHAGYNKTTKLWHPYQDPAGWHIGYGHKINDDNELKKFKNGVTEVDINKLLNQDLAKANQIVENYIRKKYKVSILLSVQQREMLLDFAFNLGTLDTFPKFVDSVLKNDKQGIEREYKRHVNGKELKSRNQQFHDRFLK